jgi:hypothetical protein
MSGQKRLNRVAKHNRVVAFPTRKVEREVTDNMGQPILDKNGNAMTEEIQLYKIKPMR